ncbi:DUF6011 domain-containing protein [Streptomyces sp. NPDC056084]|uniref:DUF6011 domain-containing protein n=1 Tax=unclassified Streptomyces TaxID=2593676 RepID=UPI0035DF7CA0
MSRHRVRSWGARQRLTSLRDTESRRWGLGPECRRGLRSAPTPQPFTVEQEQLPGVAPAP